MEFQAFILSLLLLTIVSQTDSRSLDTPVQCATTCTESNTYREGYTYTFQYEANVASFVDQVDGPYSTEVLIRADTQVSVLSPCEMVLKVADASIRDPTRTMDTTDWIDHMTRNPLHFSWQDGRIPDVCASNDDPTWVVNLKRAMLSTMLFPGDVQAGSEPVTVSMTDVTGECEWEYDVTETGGVTTSHATKDYRKCQGRNQQLLLSHFNKYYSDSEQQSFIKSSQACEQTIYEGRVKRTNCQEEHVFVPFSKEDSGVKTKITQSSSEVSMYRSRNVVTLLDGDSQRTSIVFEKEEDSFSSSDISEVQSVVQNLCAIMETEHYSKVGEDFIKMVFLLRRLDASALGQVYSSLDGACPRFEDEIKAMFQDALQWCGSEGCVVYAAQKIESGAFTDATATRWLTSMSLIAEPTIPMLRALSAVVRSGRLSEKSYLTMGTMIHRLTSTVENCMSDPDVVIALEILEQKLGVNCRTSNPEAKQDILLVLRAIGNAGGFTAPSILAECARESDNDMETRIAAIQAFRRMPCNTDRSVVSRILFDSSEDAELRIGAYMALMQCPTPTLIKQVIQMMDNEPIQQVASFISTHLQQLQESADPLKGYIKPLLVEAEFAKKYNLDPRKFSRFYEATLFSDTLNAGATVESSVVWSPKSFMPRSGSVDLTLDVFGQAVNLFEIGGRVEGVETLIQSFIGPKGYLKNNRFSDLFTNDQPEDEDEEEDEDEDAEVEEEPVVARTARSSSDARLREIKQQHESRVPTENKPSASWYLRLFGNEMYYKNTDGMPALSAESESINVAPFLTRLAQGSQYQYHDDMMLMNSAFVIPTIAGLPLTLAFNGTASIDVTASGRLDMTELFTANPTLNVLGSIQPRGVVLVTGSMSVDAHVTRTGIATESTAVTSWTLGGKLSIENGRTFTVKVDTPNQRNTLFSFKHKLLKIVDDEKVDARSGLLGLARVESDCQREFAGQRICMSNSMTRYPAEEVGSYVLPTTGPVNIDIYMEKTDSGFDHYLFEANYLTEHSQTSDIPTLMQANMVMDTPGSATNRRTTLNVHYNMDEMTFDVEFAQPENSVTLQGNMENGLSRKSATLRYVRNGDETSFAATYEKQIEARETRWELTTEVITPTKTVNGRAFMSFDPTRHAVVNVSIANLTPEPIAVNLALKDNSDTNRNKLIYKGNGLLKIPGIVNNGVSFDMKIKPKSDAFKFSLDYEFRGQEPERIVFLNKRRDRSTATRIEWDAEQKFYSSQFSLVNHNIMCNYTNGPGEVGSYVKVGYGAHAGHEDNNRYLSLSQKFAKTESVDRNSLSGSVALKMPSYNMDYSAGIEHFGTQHSFNTTINFASYLIKMFAENNAHNSGLLDMRMQTQFPTPWGQIHVTENLRETQAKMYHLSTQLSVGKSGGLSFTGNVYFNNLAEGKRLETIVRGANGENLLHQVSIFNFLTPSGFHTQHSVVSRYNHLVNITIRHEGQEGTSFETNVIAVHGTSMFAHLKLDFDDEPTHSTKLLRIEYLDDVEIQRFVELSTNRTLVDIDGHYSGSLKFTNNVPDIKVKSVIIQTSLELSMDSKNANGNLVVDGSELFGAEASHSYNVADDASGLSTVGLTVRQTLCKVSPNKMAVTASMRSTLNNECTVTFNYHQDDIEKLATSFLVAHESKTVTGQATQHFSESFPTVTSYSMQVIDNGVDMRMEVDGRTATLQATKPGESSLLLTWDQNISFLTVMEVPTSIESTVGWGEEPRSRSTGAWLTATVNQMQFVKVNALYSSENQRVTFSVRHDVPVLYRFVPQIQATASQQIAAETGFITGSIRVNSTEILMKELNWSPTQIQLRAHHALPMLSAYSIPGLMEVLVAKSGSMEDGSARIVTDVDQVHSELELTSNQTVAMISYNSNCPVIGGEAELAIQKQTTDGSFTISYTRNGVEKTATVHADFDESHNQVSVNWNQNIYLNENYPHIPQRGSLSFTYGLSDDTFVVETTGTYNDYRTHFRFDLSYPINKKKAVITIESEVAQNIFPLFADFSTIIVAKTDYTTNAFGSVKYTINEEPERVVKLQLDMNDVVDNGNDIKVFAARFTHNQPTKIVPRKLITEITIMPQESSYEVAVSVTTNNNVKRITLIGGFNPENNTVTVGYTQDIPQLHKRGVYRNVTFTANGNLYQTDAGHSITGEASVQINNDVYSLGGTGGYESEDDVITVTTDVHHHIEPLLKFKVPKRVRKVSTINYGMLDKQTVAFQLRSKVNSTFHDIETGTDIQLQNEVSAGVNVKILNYQVSFSGSHDFDLSGLPHNIQYDISASWSTDDVVLHKSLKTSLTLDGVKQTASVTLNQNLVLERFFFATKHNVTAILAYGVPGNMSINFERHGNYDADLKVVYDTAKKSVGFKLDYDRTLKKLIFYFHHNFDVLKQQLKIPKTIGFESQCLIKAKNMQSMVKYVWADVIAQGDLNSQWHASWDSPRVTISMTQNITRDEVFPISISLVGSTQFNNRGFTANLDSSRGYSMLTCNKHQMGATSTDVTCSLRQNFDREIVPALSEFQVRYATEEDMANIELTLSCDHDRKIHTVTTAHWNLEEWTASVTMSNEQALVENAVFPTTYNFYTNGSVSIPRVTTFTSLSRSNGSPLQLAVDAGMDIEGNSAHLQIKHKQNPWEAYIPKNFRVDGSYSGNSEGLFVEVDVKRNRVLNRITGGYAYSLTDTVYGRVSYSHNFDEYQALIPMHGMVKTLLGKTPTSVFGQFNVTVDDLTMTHAAQASYSNTTNEMTGMFEVLINNPYLQNMDVPDTLSAAIAANWADGISTSASVQYGDQTFRMMLESDEETSAVLHLRQTFDFEPNDLRVSVTGSKTNGQATMEVSIDGVTQDIVLSGEMQTGRGLVHLVHGFKNIPIPRDISLSGSYRFTPDIHVAAGAMVDGTQYSVSGGFEKLPNGFRVTSSLLDGVIRSATFVQDITPGSISFQLDHNIPELSFVPQSLGVSASARLEPRPNVTASIRHEDVTQRFTAEADIRALEFALSHDFGFLPLPTSLAVKLSGSMNPPQGSIKIDMNGRSRTATATIDPESMLGSLVHNFPEIPLPESLSVNIGGSMSPLSGRVSVAINGVNQELSATVDTSQMRAITRHNSQILDGFLVPRDIAFGFNGDAESMSGELYLSIDGNFRNIGGSINRPQGILTWFHNTPELYLPRNVTLRVIGGMEPIQGSITLTIDNVERQVAGDIDVRSLAMLLSHSVPEVEVYLPTNMRASLDFTASSAQVLLSYTKSGTEKSASGAVNFSPNHITIQAAQTIFEGKYTPARVTLDVAGSLEYKNFTVMTEFDDTYFNMNGNFFDGTSSDGWYGITTSAQHNVRMLRKKLMFPRNMQVEFKGRKSDETYEGSIILDIIKAHDYRGYASITPRLTENTFTLNTEYNHQYVDIRRSVSGSLTASNANGYTLSLVGSQTIPETVNLRLDLSADVTVAESVRGYFHFSGRQNIPELSGTALPNSIQDGSLTFDLGALMGNMAFVMNMDGSMYDIRTEYNHEMLEDSITQRLHTAVVIPGYNSDQTQIFTMGKAADMSSINVRFEDTRGDRADDISLTLNINKLNPSIILKLKQRELNTMNVPVMNELSYLIREVGRDQIDWSLKFTSDGSWAMVGLKAAKRQGHLKWNFYFDNNIPMLVYVNVPTHMANKLETNYSRSETLSTLNLNFGTEYNSYAVWYNITEEFGEARGSVTHGYSHNIPSIEKYLKYRKYQETYRYAVASNVLTGNGLIMQDGNQVSDYTLTYDYHTGDIQYSQIYDNGKDDAVYRLISNEDQVELLVSFNRTGQNIFKIFYSNQESVIQGEYHNIIVGPEMNSNFIVHKQEGMPSLNATTSITIGDLAYSVEFGCVPVASEGMRGLYMSTVYSVSDGSSLSINLMDKYGDQLNGNMTFNMVNNNVVEGLASRTKVVGSYAITGYNLAFKSGRMRIESDLGYTIPEGAFNLEWNFFQNVKRTYPRDFTATIDITNGHWRANVIVDQIDLFSAQMLNQEINTEIRTLAGESVFSLTGNYSHSENTYHHDLQVQWNENQIAAVGRYSPETFNLRVSQPWTETASTVILSGSNRIVASGEASKSMKVQWGGEDDSFGVTMSRRRQRLQDSVSVTLDQPSDCLGFHNWEGTWSVDQSKQNIFNMDFKSELDGTPTAFAIHYQGDLPQPLGHHELTVNVTQPFFESIPNTFVTTGNMTISATGLYESSWHITSKGEQLVTLVKNYRPNANGYSFDFLWRQSCVTMPARYIFFKSSNVTSGNSITTSASLQVDDMPIMSGKLTHGSVQEENGQNSTMRLSMETGPLAEYLGIRDLDVTTWYKYEQQRSREMPAFSITVGVDGLEYHFDGSYNCKSNKGSVVQFLGDLTIQHPHDVQLLGLTLPKSNTGNFKLDVKPKGIRVMFNYDNELMDNEFQVVKKFRMKNGDRILDYSATIKYSGEGEPNDIEYGIQVVSNENNFDRSATISLAYPAGNIDSELILSGLNSDSNFKTEMVFKNYDNTELKLWKCALSYGKTSNIIQLTIKSPDIDEATLRGDLSQVIRQAGHLIQTLASESTSTGLQFLKGMKQTDDGYNMYIGFEYNDEPTHTMHLIVGLNSESAYALLEAKRDFESVAKLGKVSVNLVDGRLVQVETKTFPVVTDFLHQLFSTCDNEVARKINWFADQLEDFLLSCKTAVGGSEAVQRKSNHYIDMAISKINEIRSIMIDRMTSAFNGASGGFDSQYTVIQELLRQATLTTEKAITDLRNIVAGPFADLVDQHYGTFLRRIGTALKLKLRIVEELLAKVNADQVFKELIDEAIQKISSFVLTNGEVLFGASRRPLSELIAVTDSEVIINIPLEFELEHFVPLPTLDEIKTWAAQTALALKVDECVKQLYSYVDKYYQVRAVIYMPHDERLPPFKGHAFVSGFRHFSTFDKRHIDFTSMCPTTHVLATDMRNDNFTITLSYGDSSSDINPSIEMIVENRRVILSDKSVQINGRVKDLPLVHGKIAATLEGKVFHLRHINGDVDVGCDFNTNLCTVDVSPYYFGATGGMAGIYNNEPSDDMTSPVLTQSPDVATLASEWEASDTNCANGNAYRSCASNSIPTKCRELFESTNSPFRSCFPLVDPKSFMQMCVDDLCENNDVAKSCSASAAYAYRCKLAGAPLIIPDDANCAWCQDVHGHNFSVSSSRSTEISGVHLIFVVQESACMKRSSRKMRKFIKGLYSHLNNEGLSHSFSSVVGYGGIDGSVAPHTYTFDTNMVTSRWRSLHRTLNRMQLSEAGTGSDALEAISYASKLPFIAGTKPIIVLLSCDGCSSQTAVSYGDVESQLKKQSIGFLHLSHQPITTGSKSVYGYDSRTAFAKRNLDSSVVKPIKSDSCVPLATVSGGSVWDATQMRDSKFQSKLITYLTQSAGFGSTVTCTCQINEAGFGTSVCVP